MLKSKQLLNKTIHNDFNQLKHKSLLHQIRISIYIFFKICFKCNRGDFANVLTILLIFGANFLSQWFGSTPANSESHSKIIFLRSQASNYIMMYTAVIATVVAVFGIVNKTYSDMKFNVMYKRIGLSGIGFKSFILGYITICVITTLISWLLIWFCNFFTFLGIAINTNAIGVSDLGRIMFNTNFVVSLFYIVIIMFLIIAAACLFNSLNFNPSLGSTIYPLFILATFGILSAIIYIPQVAGPTAREWGTLSIFNSYHYIVYFNKHELANGGIQNWPVYGVVLYFIGWITVIPAATIGIFYLALKHFKWSK